MGNVCNIDKSLKISDTCTCWQHCCTWILSLNFKLLLANSRTDLCCHLTVYQFESGSVQQHLISAILACAAGPTTIPTITQPDARSFQYQPNSPSKCIWFCNPVLYMHARMSSICWVAKHMNVTPSLNWNPKQKVWWSFRWNGFDGSLCFFIWLLRLRDSANLVIALLEPSRLTPGSCSQNLCRHDLPAPVAD